jgi:hypothetical protein
MNPFTVRASTLLAIATILTSIVACGGRTEQDSTDDPGEAGASSGCLAGSGVVVLAPPVTSIGAESAGGIAVDSTSVYWGYVGEGSGGVSTVMKVPTCGGIITTLASGQDVATGIAINAANIYWANGDVGDSGAVMRVPLGGGNPMMLEPDPYVPFAVAVDATSVYWENLGAGQGNLMKAALDGGPPATLVTSTGDITFQNIALDATSVYWTSTGGALSKVPIEGGAVTALVAAGDPGNQATFAVGGGSIYWYSTGPIIPDPGGLMKMPVSGGPATMLASSLNFPTGIAVDGANVYFMDLDCDGSGVNCTWAVKKVSVDGGAPSTVVSGWQDVTYASPVALAVDATTVYWENADGSVMAFSPK